MLRRSFALIAFAAIQMVGPTSVAQAGPLIDWLLGGRRQPPAYPVGAPVPLGNGYGVAPGAAAGYAGYPAMGGGVGYPGLSYPGAGYSAGYPGSYPGYASGSYSAGYAPFGMNAQNSGYAANLGTYYGSQLPVIGPNGAGYTAQMPSGIAATMPQTYSYVPNFNSNALRAPVTYYRPLLTTDPNTGGQVVAMAPCTSYQYLTQRTPALGQSALYGSYQPPQPQMQSIPSYTLPSGGIPIASNSIGAPSLGGSTALGYSPYSSYSIAQPAIGSQNYQTAPVGSNYYNSSPSGGSTGSYAQPIPGLVAPPASGFSAPNGVSPNYGQPSYPGTSFQGNPSSVMPPPSSGFNDPANTPPSLPMERLKPRLQSIIPEATPSGQESASNTRNAERSMLNEPAREVPVMNPIPAPEGMEKPSWNPGLLRTEDMTALRPVTRSVQFAGQSKKIHWASFEQELTLGDTKTESQRNTRQATQTPELDTASRLQLQPSSEEATSTYLRPVLRSQDSQPVRAADQASRPSSTPNSSGSLPSKKYDTSGWKASR